MPQNRRSYEKTRRIALSGLLFALAMALSFIEVAEPRGWKFVEHITPDTSAEIKAWKKLAKQKG